MAEACYILSVFRAQRHPSERAARSFTRHGDTVSSHAIRIDCLLCVVEGRRHQHKSLAILVRGMGKGLSGLAETRQPATAFHEKTTLRQPLIFAPCMNLPGSCPKWELTRNVSYKPYHKCVPALEIELRRSSVGAVRNATSRDCLSIRDGQEIVQPQLAKKRVPFPRQRKSGDDREGQCSFQAGTIWQGLALHGGRELARRRERGGLVARRSWHRVQAFFDSNPRKGQLFLGSEQIPAEKNTAQIAHASPYCFRKKTQE